jgi:hypothetical protein
MVTHPYSIFIWHAKHGVRGEPSWYEALQAFTDNGALYTANLMHMDSQEVIKVVRYGINFACFPDEHTVELCERQLAKHKQPHERTSEDFESEITFIDENDFSIG